MSEWAMKRGSSWLLLAALLAALGVLALAVSPSSPARATGRASGEVLLETVTVAPNGMATTHTVFSKGTKYRFVFSGTRHRDWAGTMYDQDAFYCYGSRQCGSSGTGEATGVLIQQGVRDIEPESGTPQFPAPFSSSHVYQLDSSQLGCYNGICDGIRNSGPLTFVDATATPPSATQTTGGSLTVQIYGPAAPKSETTNFAFKATDHIATHKGRFVLITVKGLGKLVGPAPTDTGGTVFSTSSTGAGSVSVVLFSPSDVLILNEGKVSYRVTGGYFEHTGLGSIVQIRVKVTKSTEDKCHVGRTGAITMFDGSTGSAHRPDTLSVVVPGCFNHHYKNGQGTEKVAVAVRTAT